MRRSLETLLAIMVWSCALLGTHSIYALAPKSHYERASGESQGTKAGSWPAQGRMLDYSAEDAQSILSELRQAMEGILEDRRPADPDRLLGMADLLALDVSEILPYAKGAALSAQVKRAASQILCLIRDRENSMQDQADAKIHSLLALQMPGWPLRRFQDIRNELGRLNDILASPTYKALWGHEHGESGDTHASNWQDVQPLLEKMETLGSLDPLLAQGCKGIARDYWSDKATLAATMDAMETRFGALLRDSRYLPQWNGQSAFLLAVKSSLMQIALADDFVPEDLEEYFVHCRRGLPSTLGILRRLSLFPQEVSKVQEILRAVGQGKTQDLETASDLRGSVAGLVRQMDRQIQGHVWMRNLLPPFDTAIQGQFAGVKLQSVRDEGAHGEPSSPAPAFLPAWDATTQANLRRLLQDNPFSCLNELLKLCRLGDPLMRKASEQERKAQDEFLCNALTHLYGPDLSVVGKLLYQQVVHRPQVMGIRQTEGPEAWSRAAQNNDVLLRAMRSSVNAKLWAVYRSVEDFHLESAAKFIKDRLIPREKEITQRDGALPLELYLGMIQEGIVGTNVEQSHGGAGLSVSAMREVESLLCSRLALLVSPTQGLLAVRSTREADGLSGEMVLRSNPSGLEEMPAKKYKDLVSADPVWWFEELLRRNARVFEHRRLVSFQMLARNGDTMKATLTSLWGEDPTAVGKVLYEKTLARGDLLEHEAGMETLRRDEKARQNDALVGYLQITENPFLREVLSGIEEAYLDHARYFIETRIIPRAEEVSAQGGLLPMDLYFDMVQEGFVYPDIPQVHGGVGLTPHVRTALQTLLEQSLGIPSVAAGERTYRLHPAGLDKWSESEIEARLRRAPMWWMEALLRRNAEMAQKAKDGYAIPEQAQAFHRRVIQSVLTNAYGQRATNKASGLYDQFIASRHVHRLRLSRGEAVAKEYADWLDSFLDFLHGSRDPWLKRLYDAIEDVYVDQVREFAEDYLVPHALSIQQAGSLPPDILLKMEKAGLLNPAMRQTEGGIGLSARAWLRRNTILESVLPGLPLVLDKTPISPEVMDQSLREEREWWLGQLLKRYAYAHSRPIAPQGYQDFSHSLTNQLLQSGFEGNAAKMAEGLFEAIAEKITDPEKRREQDTEETRQWLIGGRIFLETLQSSHDPALRLVYEQFVAFQTKHGIVVDFPARTEAAFEGSL